MSGINEELRPLVSLLDDKDSVVSECVRKELASFGPEIVGRLRQMRSARDLDVPRELIDEVADSLNADFLTDEFARLVAKGGDNISLFDASCVVSALFDDTFDKESFRSRFYRCSSEFMAESSDQRTAVENIRIFNHIFFFRQRFAVYDVEMKELEYALVSKALHSGKGNPFTIAFIYLMLARIVGLPLEVMSFPGGFVPVYVEGGKELFYVNVYRNGEIFMKDRLQEFISALGVPIDMKSFKVSGDATLMTIYLESLQYLFMGKGDENRCSVIGRLLEYLGPERYLTMDEEA